MNGQAKCCTVPVTIRLPLPQVKRIEAAAEAAGLDRSRYLRWRLKGLEPPSSPALAALARIIAIHELMAVHPASDSELVAELRELVLKLAAHVHEETQG